ncbi:hypothetical protein JZ751_005926 [Albula glossodonta]|uniref:G-protein coupled receptors family 1 profile domain-containing protein n=1 Tax=Albula glossodonta TaxID=121402 RepID=A0A8T2P3X3_9TELE|nr:hypothetical protein JZ751_005926 [Albula glossodonta]
MAWCPIPDCWKDMVARGLIGVCIITHSITHGGREGGKLHLTMGLLTKCCLDRVTPHQRERERGRETGQEGPDKQSLVTEIEKTGHKASKGDRAEGKERMDPNPELPPQILDRIEIRALRGPLQNLDFGNIFVVSLAVADLVVAIYPYPLVLTSIFHNGWSLGYVHCQISGFLMGLSVIGSIFNITGIAINRYCYICHSLKYDKLYSDKNSLCYVFLIWVLTVIAIVPNLFVGSLQYDPRVYSCTFVQSASSAYTIAVVFFHFILPIMIVTYCYLRIWILVIQVRRRVKPDIRPKLTPHDVRNFVTMFVVFVLFAVCWAPLNFIGLAVAVNPVTPLIPEATPVQCTENGEETSVCLCQQHCSLQQVSWWVRVKAVRTDDDGTP